MMTKAEKIKKVFGQIMIKRSFLILFLALGFLFLSIFIFWQIYLSRKAEIKEFQEKIGRITQIINEQGLPTEKFQFGSPPHFIGDDFLSELKGS